MAELLTFSLRLRRPITGESSFPSQFNSFGHYPVLIFIGEGGSKDQPINQLHSLITNTLVLPAECICHIFLLFVGCYKS